jgi:hypothetical protein
MRVVKMTEAFETGAERPEMSPEQREMGFKSNLNTCHIWDEDGEQVRRIRAGEDIGAPLSVTRRLDKLGRDPGEWGRIRG